MYPYKLGDKVTWASDKELEANLVYWSTRKDLASLDVLLFRLDKLREKYADGPYTIIKCSEDPCLLHLSHAIGIVNKVFLVPSEEIQQPERKRYPSLGPWEEWYL